MEEPEKKINVVIIAEKVDQKNCPEKLRKKNLAAYNYTTVFTFEGMQSHDSSMHAWHCPPTGVLFYSHSSNYAIAV